MNHNEHKGSTHRSALIVRLCNWVGETVLALPTLHLLDSKGFDLHLVGKAWSPKLLEGHPWKVYVRPKTRLAAVQQLRALRQQIAAHDASFSQRPNVTLLTNSFSSALEARLAGLRPIGYRRDGRSMLLAHSVEWQADLHAADHYWQLGCHFAGQVAQRPTALGLQLSARHRREAESALAKAGLTKPFILLCPFSGSDDLTGKKVWPDFVNLAHALHQEGRQTLVCPGPGEEDLARTQFPTARVLPDIDLGTYAALAQMAACTVANDTGPGHLAAAAGARLVSVLGPDGADMWLAQGDRVTILRPVSGWPSLADVLAALSQAGA